VGELMKKFLVSLLLLVIVGGVVFYFGWIQFELPPNIYGVVFTKTHGWEDSVVHPGDFEWRWQRLLPTNLKLYVFSAKPHTVNTETSGSLPSAELYSRQIEGNPDFSYRLSLSVTFAVNPDALPRLVQEDGLEPDTLETWYEQFGTELQNQAVEIASQSIQNLDESQSALPVSSIQRQIQRTIEQEYPELRVTSVAVNTLEVPDIEVYEAAKETYFATLNAEREALSQATFESTQQTAAEEARLELLQRYGEVLENFPVLLDYFSLSADKDVDPLNLR
jgi:hypothetical protein